MGYPEATEREDRLNQAIAEYLQAQENGLEPDRRALMARYPDLAAEIESFFEDEDHYTGLVKGAIDHLGKAIPPSRVGTTFDGYEILEEISRTGMGIVYKARKASLDRIVALKMIREGELATPEDIYRFQFEARAASELDHPNIVPIHDVGVHEGRHYFSMKFIEGGSLAARIGSFDATASARLMEAVARAVHFAHTRGVLHRDLKPGNILLDGSGRPYVSDFGLAKKIGDDSSMTQTGTILGTPSYMAPEQASGKKGAATTAADVYSLGAILYELLTGRPPFRAETSLETIAQVVHQDAERPSRIRPSVPRDLETICLKCLEKEPHRRYAGALEMAEDLHRFLEGETILARPAGPWERSIKWARRRPAIAVLLGVIILALGALLAVSLSYNARLRAAAEREHSLAVESGAQELLARRHLYTARMNLAFEAWGIANCDRVREILKSLIPPPGREDLRGFEWHHLWKLCHQDLFTLRGHNDLISCLAFSPDGGTLVSGSFDGTVKLWDPAMGLETGSILVPPGHVDSLAFSPDGKILAIGCAEFRVILWDWRSRQIRSVLEGHGGTVNSIAFSPDGKLLATAGGDRTVLIRRTADGSEAAAIRDRPADVRCVVFSKDGSLLATADLEVVLWDTAFWRKVHTLDGRGGPVQTIAFSPDSGILAFAGWDKLVRLWDIPRGKELDPSRLHGAPISSVAFSPVSPIVASASGDHLVRLFEARYTRSAIVLQGHGSEVTALAFAPDGASLASGGKDRTVRIWKGFPERAPLYWPVHDDIIRALRILPGTSNFLTAARDGHVKAWRIHHQMLGFPFREEGAAALPADARNEIAISPDGSTIAFPKSGRGVGISRVLLEPAKVRLEEEPTLDTPASAEALAFSPDGAWLAAACGDGSLAIWERPAAVGSPWNLTHRFQTGAGDITDIAVSPDRKTIAAARRGESRVFLWDIPGGSLRAVLEGHLNWVIALAFSPDSSMLATGSLDGKARLWKIEPGGGEKPLSIFDGHTNAVSAVAFSPDGKTLVSGSDDTTLKFWDLVTGEVRATLSGHQGEIELITFSEDGRTMVTAGGTPREIGDLLVWLAGTDGEEGAR